MPPQLVLQYLVSGVIYGSIYAAVAIGFNIIYNATGIINFAQGEFAMLGGMIASSLAGIMPLALAIVAAVALTALFGRGCRAAFPPQGRAGRRPQDDRNDNRPVHRHTRGGPSCLGRIRTDPAVLQRQRGQLRVPSRRQFLAAGLLGRRRHRHRRSRPHRFFPIHDDGQGDARLLGEPRRRQPVRHRSAPHGHDRLRPERRDRGSRRSSSRPSRRLITT